MNEVTIRAVVTFKTVHDPMADNDQDSMVRVKTLLLAELAKTRIGNGLFDFEIESVEVTPVTAQVTFGGTPVTRCERAGNALTVETDDGKTRVVDTGGWYGYQPEKV